MSEQTTKQILVVLPYYWGKGDTKQAAIKKARSHGFTGKVNQAVVYSVHPSTTLDSYGYLNFPVDCPPVELEKIGMKK